MVGVPVAIRTGHVTNSKSVKLQLEQSCAVSMEQYCKHLNYGKFYFTAHALKAQKWELKAPIKFWNRAALVAKVALSA